MHGVEDLTNPTPFGKHEGLQRWLDYGGSIVVWSVMMTECVSD